MKRVVLMALSVLLALVLAAPMVFAQSQGGAPEDGEDTIGVNPGDCPAVATSPSALSLAAKAKR